MSRGAISFQNYLLQLNIDWTHIISSAELNKCVLRWLYLALRLSCPPRALVLSVLLLIFNPLGSIALRLLCAGMPTAVRPVAFDIVFDFVMPRFPLGEVGVRESEDPEK